MIHEQLLIHNMANGLDLPQALIGLPGQSYFISFRKDDFLDFKTGKPVATIFLPAAMTAARKNRFLAEVARIDALIDLDFDISPDSTERLLQLSWDVPLRGAPITITQKSDPGDFAGSPGYEDTFGNIYLNLDLLKSDRSYGDTLNHEFGHAIGLIHPWEDGSSGGEATTIGDPNRFTDEQTVMAYRSLNDQPEQFRDADIQALTIIWGPELDEDPASPLRLSGSTAQLLYVAYYGRPADYEGLRFWQSKISESGFVYSPRSGIELSGSQAPLYNRIVVDFGNSIESQRLYADKTPKESADIVYQYCFGRNAETDPITGNNYWASKLEKREITLSQLAVEVALGAREQDLTFIRNKIASANAFAAAMDAPQERLGYGGAADDALARDWLAPFGPTAATAVEADAIVGVILATP